MHEMDDFLSSRDEFNRRYERFARMLKSSKPIYGDVDEFIEAIDFLIDVSQLNKAMDICNIGLKQHPNTDDLLIKKAHIYIEIQNYPAAKKILQELLSRQKNQPDVYFYYGILYLVTNQIQKSTGYFDIALEKTNEFEKTEMLYTIANSLLDHSQHAAAIKYFQMIFSLDPANFDALIDIGNCYDEINETPKAITLFNDFLDKSPYNEAVWYALGTMYENQNQNEQAINSFEFSIAIDPEYTAAYFSLSLIYSRANNYEKSIYYLEQLLEYEPENMHAHFYLAESYYQSGDKDKAMSAYEKTLIIDPSYADAWYGIGEIYYDENKLPECLFYVRKALKLDPDEPLYWQRLGILQKQFKYLNYAIKSFQRVLDIDPYDETTWIHLAESYFELKMFEKTIEISKTALEKFHSPVYSFLIAAVYIEQNNLDKALLHVEEGVKKDIRAFDNFAVFYPKILSFDSVRKIVNLYQSKP